MPVMTSASSVDIASFGADAESGEVELPRGEIGAEAVVGDEVVAVRGRARATT